MNIKQSIGINLEEVLKHDPASTLQHINTRATATVRGEATKSEGDAPLAAASRIQKRKHEELARNGGDNDALEPRPHVRNREEKENIQKTTHP